MIDDSDQYWRLAGGLGILCGVLLLLYAQADSAPVEWGGLTLAIGLLSALAGFLAFVMGDSKLDRALLTASGALAGLGLCFFAISRDNRFDDVNSVLWTAGVIFIGASASAVQWFRSSPSSAIAALPVGVALILIVPDVAALSIVMVLVGMVFADVLSPGEDLADTNIRSSDRADVAAQPGPMAEDMQPADRGRSSGRPDDQLTPIGARYSNAVDLGGEAATHDRGGNEGRGHSPSVGSSANQFDGESNSVKPADPVRASAAVAASAADEAYMTIGVAPKLPRSTDVSPPRVKFTAPAGHQFDGFSHGPFMIRAASHVGTKHMNSGQIRQDAYAVTVNSDDRFIVAAVADGVGSEPWSALGADWAVASVVRNGSSLIDDRGIPISGQRLAEMAAEEVYDNAARHWAGAKPHEFSTTLVIAVVNIVDFTLELTRVGDSNAFTRQPNGWIGQFMTDDELGAATNAIPATTPSIETVETELKPGGCVLLASDGIADLIHNSNEVHESLFDVLARPVSALEFSSIAGFQRRQAHDDQTALAIWRGNGSAKKR